MASLSFYSLRNKTSILGCFFWLFLFEASLGGSGRLIEIGGGLTLRKVNFCIGLALSFFLIYFLKRIKKDVAVITIAFFVSLIIPTIIGFLNYGLNDKVMENFLMQSFFLLLPFYSLFIKNENDINKVKGILKFVSLFIAVVYLLVLALIAIGVINFLTVYTFLTHSVEFMGRGDSFFWFKGFLYLCIGLFFFDIEEGAFLKRIKQFVVLVAVYFTFTRGFILALFVSVFLHQLIFKSLFKSLLVIFFSIVVVGIFSQYYIASSFDRKESDEVRTIQIKQTMDAVDPISIIAGHGFGEGVAIRDNHFEINYLEIFHKQGLIGLFFWFSILIYIGLLYFNCKRLGYEKKARPFFLAALFIYVQSATNPYLTNSIGLNMIMISIVCLNIYINDARESIYSNSYI